MNTKRNLIVLTFAAALSSCAAPQEKPKPPVAAAAPVIAPAPPEPTNPEPKENDSVVILPLDQPPGAEAAPVSEPPPAAPPAAPAPSPEQASDMPADPAAGPSSEPNAAPDAAMPPPAVTPAAPPPPARPHTVVADRTPREFTITVEKKSPRHPNYGRGSEIGFVVDGVPGEELVLTRGVTYVFHVRTNVQHDFYFSTSPMGRGAGTVTDGIRGQFTYIGDVSFTPSASTPEVLYYECRNHAYMGGKIHIANAGDRVTVGGETRAAGGGEQHTVTAAQVKQKLDYAETLVNSSPVAKWAAGAADAEAKALLDKAKVRVRTAQAALTAGDNAAAMDAVDEAVRLVGEAGRRMPADSGQDDKARYNELLDRIQGFDKSYQKNVEKGVKPKSGKTLDRAGFDALMREGSMLAGRGEYAEAVKRLETADDMIVEALGALLQAQTMIYDKNFATPKEEYEYELSRYDSYVELIPLAIEQRGPLPQTVTMMHQLAGRAKEIHDEGTALAAKGDHKMAIMALQAATEKLQQALRLAGVQ
jgi:tetratricopeptide (TPR) repeat protein